MTQFKEFKNAYIEAMYWADCGDSEQPPNDAELSEDAEKDIDADCWSFYRRTYFYFEEENKSAKDAGHDFYLTRQGHGAGFWDGDWPTYGDMLTRIAKGYGEADPYLGDDGLIYIN